jgi:N-acetylmuramoyl-L-alanine amidase
MTYILLDAGHGGMFGNQYQTEGKKYYEFTNLGKTVYEGELNRQIADVLSKMLRMETDFHVIPVYHTYKDTSLVDRVNLANAFANVVGDQNCIYLSLHNNAASASLKGEGSTAYGTEVFTSQGQTDSDDVADLIIEKIKKALPSRRMRTDFRDGDGDKEAQFYVLRKTSMPAVLIEFGFFDNWEDYMFVKNNIAEFCGAITEALIDYTPF